MPRFVLLRHECPPDYRVGSHWDLMLEHDGVLLTWSLSKLPAVWGGAAGVDEVAAERLADHRLAYLDYEGPVSGDRGEVRRVLGGECTLDYTENLLVQATVSGIGQEVNLLLTHFDGDHWRLNAVGI